MAAGRIALTELLTKGGNLNGVKFSTNVVRDLTSTLPIEALEHDHAKAPPVARICVSMSPDNLR